MDTREYDDQLYGALTDALSNSGLPISAREKARLADELCAEGMRLLVPLLKRKEAPAKAPTAKRTRGPNKPKAKAEAPEAPTAAPDATTPAPFGAAH